MRSEKKGCEEEKEMRAIEAKKNQEVSREEESGGEKGEKIVTTRLRQKMERMDREKLPAYPPLQKRKWSVQRRQNSKLLPPPKTPQRIHLVCVKRRSASFVLHRDKGVLHVTKEREIGGAQKG